MEPSCGFRFDEHLQWFEPWVTHQLAPRLKQTQYLDPIVSFQTAQKICTGTILRSNGSATPRFGVADIPENACSRESSPDSRPDRRTATPIRPPIRARSRRGTGRAAPFAALFWPKLLNLTGSGNSEGLSVDSRVGEAFILALDVKDIAMARRSAPGAFLPGEQALARVGNRIVRLQPLPGGVEQMHAPGVGVATLFRNQQIPVDAASTPASTGVAPWKISSCRPTRMPYRSWSRLITPACCAADRSTV
jgi:hypothetical protein